MKRTFIAFITAGLAFVACNAHAGLARDQQIDGGVTNAFNYVPANTTNVYAGSGTVFDASRSIDATLEFSFACTGPSTANYTVSFDAAVNGSNSDRWLTNALTIMVAGKGTGIAVGLTNLPAGMKYPAWRVNYIGNTNASSPAITNVLVRVQTRNESTIR